MNARARRPIAFATTLLTGMVLLNASALAQAPAGDAPSTSSAATATAAEASAEPADDSVPGTAPDAATPSAAQPIELAAPTDSTAARKRALEASLAGVDRERAGQSLLLPWLATSVSAALLLTGLGAGLGHAVGCAHSCTTPFWPGWLVIAGTTFGTASVIWLERRQRDLAELDSRRYHLDQELQRMRWNEAPRSPTTASLHAALGWSGRF
jgi:hypothetical protein